MKCLKLLLVLLSIGFLLFLPSCSKDDVTETENSLLVGTWSAYKEDILYNELDKETPNKTVTFNDGEEIVTFNSDGSYCATSNSEISLGTYSYNIVKQDIITEYTYNGMKYTGTAKVQELNSISLILYYTDEDGLSYFDYYKRIK